MNYIEELMNLATEPKNDSEYEKGFADAVGKCQYIVELNAKWGWEHRIINEAQGWVNCFYNYFRNNDKAVCSSFLWVIRAYKELIAYGLTMEQCYFHKEKAEKMLKTLRFILDEYDDINKVGRRGYKWV